MMRRAFMSMKTAGIRVLTTALPACAFPGPVMSEPSQQEMVAGVSREVTDGEVG